MSSALSSVRTNSLAIMEQIRAIIPDTRFGIVTHRDYPGTYNSCGYSGSYGSSGDYPYRRDLALTDNPTLITTTLNSYLLEVVQMDRRATLEYSMKHIATPHLGGGQVQNDSYYSGPIIFLTIAMFIWSVVYLHYLPVLIRAEMPKPVLKMIWIWKMCYHQWQKTI